MSAPIITSQEVRVFLMDKPELNTLVPGVRWTEEMLSQAAINVVDYINVTSPSIGTVFTVETFPSRYILLTGMAGYLLKSASINQASNEFNYTAEGMTVQDHDKSEIFAKLGAEFWDEFKELVRNKKIQMNVNRAYGTVHSEYNYRVF
jgi:hypothetical protein